MKKTYNVLILCTGNSARSILGEALINQLGQNTFRGYSAGSTPTGKVNPFAIKLLEQFDLPTQGLRSKSWDEFTVPNAPKMDFIFTVCDNAAAETCPIWPGQPITAHWGLPDPAAVEGDDTTKMQAFRDTYQALENRVKAFINLPINKLDDLKLQQKLNEIGQTKQTEPA